MAFHQGVTVETTRSGEPKLFTQSRLGRMVGRLVGRPQLPHFASSEVGDGFDDFTPEGKRLARVGFPDSLGVSVRIREVNPSVNQQPEDTKRAMPTSDES